MTALSIALVLCCAMVCGTRIYLRRQDVRARDANDTEYMRDVSARVAKAGACIEELILLTSEHSTSLKALCDDVDSIKARSAFGVSR